MKRLGTLGILLSCILSFNLLLIWCWQRRRNQAYYSAMARSHRRRTNDRRSTNERADNKISSAFHKFPGACVLPGLLLLGCKLYITGLVTTCANLLIAADECGGRCRAVVIAVSTFGIGFILFGWYVVIDWNVRFRRTTWRPAAVPASVDDVGDPLLRLLSRVYLHICRLRGSKSPLAQRVRGKVARPAEYTDEPQRTERLLRRWYWLRHSNAADTMDAFQFAFFLRGSGFSWTTTIFDHYGLTTQMLIAALAGLSQHVEPGTTQATCQVSAVAALQLLHGVYCLAWLPSNDKAEACVEGLQFSLEGARTVLLLVQGALHGLASVASVQQASLILSLVAVAVPIVRYFYDAVIVQLITLHRDGKLNKNAMLVAGVGLLANILILVTKLVGFEAHSAGSKAHAASKLTARTADQGVTVEVAIAISDLADDTFQLTGLNEHSKAAVHIQRVQRSRSGRSSSDQRAWVSPLWYRRSAVRIQAAARGFIVRRRLMLAWQPLYVPCVPSVTTTNVYAQQYRQQLSTTKAALSRARLGLRRTNRHLNRWSQETDVSAIGVGVDGVSSDNPLPSSTTSDLVDDLYGSAVNEQLSASLAEIDVAIDNGKRTGRLQRLSRFAAPSGAPPRGTLALRRARGLWM